MAINVLFLTSSPKKCSGRAFVIHYFGRAIYKGTEIACIDLNYLAIITKIQDY